MIAGLQKMTLLDYPGKVACTVFLQGCNYRCPFCHNSELLPRKGEEFMTEEEFLSFLKKRQGLLDAVCVSGGEPTLCKDLPRLLKDIKDLGFLVKLDTNGSDPAMLKALVAEGLVDYVAMDIKNCREKYAETVGIPGFDTVPVEESVRLLQTGGVDFEFRTTVVKEFHTAQDFVSIGQWLAGSPRYFLQQFVDSGDLVGHGCTAVEPLQLKEFADLTRPFFGSVELRGIN